MITVHYLLFYEVGPDYVSRRAQFRDEHLKKAWQASGRGELVLGGALADPVDGAVLLFKGDSPEVAERFARADPYVTSGAVKNWHVREWNTVAGEEAANPVKPSSVLPPPSPGENSPIARIWKARTSSTKADVYVQHATQKVFPALDRIEGHRGAYLLQRMVDGAVDFVVVTLWDSMAAVRKFAGSQVEQAVVEPEAQAVLTSFDEIVTHYEVVGAPRR